MVYAVEAASITRSAASKIRKYPGRVSSSRASRRSAGTGVCITDPTRRRRALFAPTTARRFPKSHAHTGTRRPRRDAVGVATLSFVSSTFPEALGGSRGWRSVPGLTYVLPLQQPPSLASSLLTPARRRPASFPATNATYLRRGPGPRSSCEDMPFFPLNTLSARAFFSFLSFAFFSSTK